VKKNGFTVIELVVVIIILGILSVTVVPKFFTSKGFEEYTYRNEIVSTLRAIQLRAMQQTSNNVCHTVWVTSSRLGLVATDVGGGCDNGTWHNAGAEVMNNHTGVQVDSGHAITFSLNGGTSFSFDQMGRPVSCAANCEITVAGVESIKVRIESEGYIHAL